MNKLVSYLVGVILGVMFLYFIGFIIALIILVTLIIAKSLIKTFKKPQEYTKWEFCSYYRPRITTLANGDKVFQNIRKEQRYNNFKNTWEFRKIVDPVKRPFSEATVLSDIYWFQFA